MLNVAQANENREWFGIAADERRKRLKDFHCLPVTISWISKRENLSSAAIVHSVILPFLVKLYETFGEVHNSFEKESTKNEINNFKVGLQNFSVKVQLYAQHTGVRWSMDRTKVIFFLEGSDRASHHLTILDISIQNRALIFNTELQAFHFIGHTYAHAYQQQILTSPLV